MDGQGTEHRRTTVIGSELLHDGHEPVANRCQNGGQCEDSFRLNGIRLNSSLEIKNMRETIKMTPRSTVIVRRSSSSNAASKTVIKGDVLLTNCALVAPI